MSLKESKKIAVVLFLIPTSFSFLHLTLLWDKIKISATVWNVVGVIRLQKGITRKRQNL